MKFWSGSLLLGLLVVLYLQSCAEGQNAKGLNVCCTSFYQRKIPVGRIVSYEETSYGCARPGIIFVLRKGYRVCVNPTLGWVQKVRGEIDWKSVDNSTDLIE